MPLTDKELLQYNRMGLIPGPDEPEEFFASRVYQCLNLKEDLEAVVGRPVAEMSKELIEQVSPLTRKLFDIVPDWVPVVFSNHQLLPWHGGCAWIVQLNESSPTTAFFQLREKFATSSRYLGIYSRDELLAHESAHIGRMLFQEQKFEELLAYRSAPSHFRQWFGPIVQSPWESLLFVLSLLFSVFSDFLLPHHALWIKTFPLLLIVLGVGRVWLRQHQLARCRKVLEGILGSAFKADAVLYRLRDSEIIAFGKMSNEEILQYAQDQAPGSLRWRVINKAYFS